MSCLKSGNHVDHVITRLVCDEIFENAIHWADYPYTARNFQTDTAGFNRFSYVGNEAGKIHRIGEYKSQYMAIFPDGVSLQPESYFYSLQTSAGK